MGRPVDDESPDDHAGLAPGEAFSALGHELRVRIIEALARTERPARPLSFSDLRERAGSPNSAKYNYHLDALVGHFLERTPEGYDFRRPGKRVAQAVLSGAVSDEGRIERTRLDSACEFCGAPIEVDYREGRLAAYCSGCSGLYGESNRSQPPDRPSGEGFLGYLDLPAAGLESRTPDESYEAALAWYVSNRFLASTGTCPWCSSPLDEWVAYCPDHQSGGDCGTCGRRYGAYHSVQCETCVYSSRVAYGISLLGTTGLQRFLTTHGINLASPDPTRFLSVLRDYEETIHDTDPLHAEFTFQVDGDTHAQTVEVDLPTTKLTTPGRP